MITDNCPYSWGCGDLSCANGCTENNLGVFSSKQYCLAKAKYENIVNGNSYKAVSWNGDNNYCYGEM